MFYPVKIAIRLQHLISLSFQSPKMLNQLILITLFAICFTLTLSIDSNDESQVDCARVPPSLWCKDNAFAKKCGVAKQCSKYIEANNGTKSTLTMMFMSFCGPCHYFVKNVLSPVYDNLKDFVEFEFVPTTKIEVSFIDLKI